MLIRKVTAGFVEQHFDTIKQTFLSQQFTAADNVNYENVETGKTVDSFNNYLPFDMVQPIDPINTINVIILDHINNSIISLQSFPDTEEGNKIAEAAFLYECNCYIDGYVNYSTNDINNILEDGYVDGMKIKILISHSTK